MAIHKTRNTGTGNGMRGTRGMEVGGWGGEVILHSGECPQTFQGIPPNMPNILGISVLFKKMKTQSQSKIS